MTLAAAVLVLGAAAGVGLAVRSARPAGGPVPTPTPVLWDVPEDALSRGRTVVIGENGGFADVNPLFARSEGDLDLCAALFAPLQRLSSDGTPVPDLALDRTIPADGSAVVFTLDPARTFPDGQPVRPSDVAFTYGAIADPTYDGPLRGRFAALGPIVADDEAGTVAFSPAEGTDARDLPPALFTVGILQASRYAYPYGRSSALRDLEVRPAGAGDYVLEELSSDRAVLVRRPGSSVSVERLVFLSLSESDKPSRLADGTADLARIALDDRARGRIGGIAGIAAAAYEGVPDLYLLFGPRERASGALARREVRTALMEAAAAFAKDLALDPDAFSRLDAGTDPASGKEDALRPRLLYFPGVDPAEAAANAALAKELARRLDRRMPIGSRPFLPVATGWPELARTAFGEGEVPFDALLLPAAEDGRVPGSLVLSGRGPGAPSEANAVVLRRKTGLLAASRRIPDLVPNPHAYPFSAVGVGFLESLVRKVPLDRSGRPVPGGTTS